MIKRIPLFLFALYFQPILAQVLNFDWVRTLESTSITNSTAMTIDKNENVISVGWFQNTQDFDPGVGTFNMNSPQENIFIQKLDASGNFVWAGQITSIGSNRTHSVVCDTSANIFLCGHLNSAADFDPGPGTFTLTPFSANQTFIAKYDPNGVLIWAHILPGQSVSNYRCEIICTPDGSVLIPGYFSGTQDFDPGSGTYSLTAGTYASAFVVKLDSGGNFVWARSLSGISSEAHGIGLYPNGDILISGMFSGTVDFDPGVGVVIGSNSGNFTDGFVLKLNSSGDYIWSKQFLGNNNTKLYTLDVNLLGDAFITGEFSGTIDIDPGLGTDSKTATGGEDVFMSILDASGNYTWGHSFGGNYNERCSFVSSDNSGNWYITGTFVEEVDMQPGAGTNILSSTTYDMYLCKYNPLGVIQWLTKIEGTSNVDYPVAIYRFLSGNVYLAGNYDDSIDFNPGLGLAEHTCVGGQDCFAMKFDECTPTSPIPLIPGLPDLIVECSYTPISYPEATEACYGIITGVPDLSFPITNQGLNVISWTYDAGNGFLTTQTQLVTIIDTTAPQPTVANLPNVNAVCSINSLTPPTATDNCSGTVTVTNDANFPVLSNTIVTWTYDDGNGNAATQTQQITIQPIDNTINQLDAVTLNASASGFSYQWLDCTNGNAPINGDTAQTFVATTNGSYAVEITNGVCTVTSDCMTISEVGLMANTDALNWFVAPNPSTDGVFTIQLPETDQEFSIAVLNELGQAVDYIMESTESGFKIRLAAANGVYLLRMTSSERTVMQRLVKG